MAAPFPSANQLNLSTAWAATQQLAQQVKNNVQSWLNMANAGNMSGAALITIPATIAGWITLFQTYGAILGTTVGVAFVQNQLNNPTFDIVGSGTQMTTVLNAIAADAKNAVPVDGGGFMELQSWNGSSVNNATFTAAALATFIADCNTLIADIT
jgi:hypothetical protein